MVPNTKKHFPEAGGAGSNRDPNSIEALRYFQPSQNRVGKHQTREPSHFVEEEARNQFRYYHGKSGVGKARPCAAMAMDGRESLVWTKNGERELSSTRADSPDDVMVDCRPNGAPSQVGYDIDDLPLGAEWSSFYCEAEF